MHKQSPAIIALFIALLLPAHSYAQKKKQSPTPANTPPATTASASTGWSSLSPAGIIDRLQLQIIAWQDEIIRGMQAQVLLPEIYREIAASAVNTETGEVKDQKLLDLLAKYGIGINTKDGKKLNNPVGDEIDTAELPETVPFIKIPDSATPAEKDRILALLAKGKTLVERVTQSKQMIRRMQTAAKDLVALAKSDAAAQALVKKYNISPPPPAASPTSHVSHASPVPTASPAPAASPAPGASPAP